MKGETMEIRFWSKVNKTGDCWEWTGVRIRKYGRFWNGDVEVGAHRHSWVMANGPIPEGKNVLHRCDNPPCVRPEHLYLGTQKENMLDAYARGRRRVMHRFGHANPSSTLTDKQLEEIRDLLKEGLPQTWIGDIVGVSHDTVSLIKRGKRWNGEKK